MTSQPSKHTRPSGDLAERARRALSRLSPLERDVLVEVVLRRRTVVQAADALGIPVRVAMTRLTRGLHAFREGLLDAA